MMRSIDTPEFTATFRHLKLPANGILHHLMMRADGVRFLDAQQAIR